MVLSVLKQLALRHSSMTGGLKDLATHRSKQTRPSLDEVLRALQSTIEIYSRVFIIVDALDELSSNCRARFLSELFALQVKTGTSIFATSRFIPEIVARFEGSTSLEIRATDEDLKTYLDGQMLRLPSFVTSSPDLQTEIKTTIAKVADGM